MREATLSETKRGTPSRGRQDTPGAIFYTIFCSAKMLRSLFSACRFAEVTLSGLHFISFAISVTDRWRKKNPWITWRSFFPRYCRQSRTFRFHSVCRTSSSGSLRLTARGSCHSSSAPSAPPSVLWWTSRRRRVFCRSIWFFKSHSMAWFGIFCQVCPVPKIHHGHGGDAVGFIPAQGCRVIGVAADPFHQRPGLAAQERKNLFVSLVILFQQRSPVYTAVTRIGPRIPR